MPPVNYARAFGCTGLLFSSGLTTGHKTRSGKKTIVGRAWTVRYVTIDNDQPGTVGDFIDQVSPGDVVVIDNAGRQDCTVWGGILSQLAMHKGIAGTVINGVCRDTAQANDAGYPLYALGNYMRTGKDRVQVAALCEPISVGGVLIKPGDLVVADIDGVVVIAEKHIDAVVDRAFSMQKIEHEIIKDVLNGMTITEARKKHNYHLLQRNPSK
ncbi:RraA family protein [Pantoea sp. LMR881]|uniref:RraA family protein n=1 Tax=Pantoea sp. LMR881 TaxID=3014336 RepID=UPI0022AE6D7C|nr:RraA family protein [Pantoea sp. LMR881]MCZ4061098.1 RraA family protein [Pantoea sp. LMR881]